MSVDSPKATAENDCRRIQQADGRCQAVSYVTAPLVQRRDDLGLTVTCQAQQICTRGGIHALLADFPDQCRY